MVAMKVFVLSILLSLVASTMSRPHDHDIDLDVQLRLINKPAIKSFETKYGDIYDCVDINKQLAFDLPLLKHHSIQMEPTHDNRMPEESSSTIATSQVSPAVQCPEGTVIVKRTQMKDLIQPKSSTFFGSNSTVEDEEKPSGNIAALVMGTNNTGVHGTINVWYPKVVPKQVSATFIYVASDDGAGRNMIATGWEVNTVDYLDNFIRFFAIWTKDSEKTSGCVDMKCAGFVQIDKEITLGMELQHVSTPHGPQYDIDVTIKQDLKTKNWWLYFGNKAIGYYPKELFTTLTNGATRAGWGGQVSSLRDIPSPTLGSGAFPEEGFNKSCYIKDMKVLDKSQAEILPEKTTLKEFNTKPECYKVSYAGDGGPNVGRYMFVGGPSDCKP